MQAWKTLHVAKKQRPGSLSLPSSPPPLLRRSLEPQALGRVGPHPAFYGGGQWAQVWEMSVGACCQSQGRAHRGAGKGWQG